MNGIRISQWSEIIHIMLDQMNRWILVQSGFIGSFDLPWSEWSRSADPDQERTLTQTLRFLVYYILYHFRKMVHNVFSIGSEYNYVQFHSSDLDLRLANFKICLKMLSEWSRLVWSHCKRKKGKGTSCWIYFFHLGHRKTKTIINSLFVVVEYFT